MSRGRLAGAAIGVAVITTVVGCGGGGSSSGRAATTPRPAATTPAVPPPPTTTAAPTAERFGASVNRLFNDGTYTPAQINAQLTRLRSAGATIARSDSLWEAAEPAPPAGGVHHYDWRFDDLLAGALAAHGLRWLAIVDYSAPWAQSIPGRDHSPPASDADFAAYAAALAERYGGGGAFWRAHREVAAEPVDTFEIWNEPDNPSFWNPRPDPARYGRLYESARASIRAVDPGARVIIGGLTDPGAFLPALVSTTPELRRAVDGVAIHPYAADPAGVLAKVRAARGTLRSLGLPSLPLYITEFGWTTSPAGALDYLPASLRPRYISQTLTGLGHTSCGIAASVLYTWVTPERDLRNKEDWFGISPPDGAGSAGTAAFADGLTRAGAPAAPPAPC